jgi:hypothetical protein
MLTSGLAAALAPVRAPSPQACTMTLQALHVQLSYSCHPSRVDRARPALKRTPWLLASHSIQPLDLAYRQHAKAYRSHPVS